MKYEGGTQSNVQHMEEFENARISEDEDHFSKEIRDWFSGERVSGSLPILVTQTPLALQFVGMDNLPIYIDVSKLKEIRDDHPEITVDVYKQIPRALTDPTMIMKSSTHPDRLVVALDVKDATGVNIIIPFELNVNRNEGRVNMMTSVYGRGDNGRINYGWYVRNMLDGNLIYAQTKKAANFLAPAGVQFPMAARKGNLVTYSIKTEKDLVKFKQEKEKEKEMVDSSKAYEGVVKTDTEAYHQEISDSLTAAEESLDDNVAKELRNIANDLHTSMKNVEEAETQCGADQETWDGYTPRHENIIRTIEQAGDAKDEGKSDKECSKAIHDAQEAMREGTIYMQERCDLILQREEEYQEQIEGLRQRIEELERERELKAQSPAELARCLAVSTEFLAAIDAIRNEAKSQPRIIASEMFAASREAVKEAYYSAKLAPTKVKSYLPQKTHKAIDGVLHSVAGVFDKGIVALEQRREGILQRSYELQSATEFYRDAISKEDEKEQRTMETERRVAGSMAKAGFGVYAIEKTLHAESPYRKEMEKGEARNIAKAAVREQEEQREEKTR